MSVPKRQRKWGLELQCKQIKANGVDKMTENHPKSQSELLS
jgi:hypothetical protein